MENSITRTKATIERKKRELEILERISGILPGDLPEPKLVLASSLWGAKASVNWLLDKVDGILPILDAYPPTEARYHAASATLGFKPQSALDQCDKTTPVEPVVLKLETGRRGYPIHESGLVFDWFAMMGDVPVHIKVAFKESCVKVSWPNIETWTTGFGKNEKLHQRLFPGFLTESLHKKVQWASGDRLTASDYTVYWPCNDASTECTLMRQFIALLR